MLNSIKSLPKLWIKKYKLPRYSFGTTKPWPKTDDPDLLPDVCAFLVMVFHHQSRAGVPDAAVHALFATFFIQILLTFSLFCSVTRLGYLLDFGQQLICPNLPHSQAFFVKVSKSLIFLVKSFWTTFIDIWRLFYWSHCSFGVFYKAILVNVYCLSSAFLK